MPVFTKKDYEDLNAGGKEPKKSDMADAVQLADVKSVLLELVRAVASGDLVPNKFRLAVEMLGSSHPHSSIVADALWLVWVEAQNSTENADAAEKRKARLGELGREALATGLTSERSLLQISEGEFLEAVGLVMNYKEGWRRKEIRANTRRVYTQRKFNLLREESEGYSKLLTLLNQIRAEALSSDRTRSAISEMTSLIGYFDLDPHRACSLTLEAFASQPDNGAFLEVLKTFNPNDLVQLLGFRYSSTLSNTSKNVNETPTYDADDDGLYTMSARLIGAEIISLGALMGHLGPSNDNIQENWKVGCRELDSAVACIGVISLAGTGSTSGQETSVQPRPAHSAAALDLDARAMVHHIIGADQGASNQRIRLLGSLLSVSSEASWAAALELFKWFGALGVDGLAVYPCIGRPLCRLINAELVKDSRISLVDGLLSRSLENASLSTEALRLTARLDILTRLVGIHLYHDISALTKLVRAVGAALRLESDQAQVPALYQLLASNILPAMALIPCNAALALEIWNAIQCLPYHVRFDLYGDLAALATKTPLLRAAFKLAETEVRRVLRRVTAPTSRREAKLTMRPLGRMLAKAAIAAPLAVADQLIRQVMGMPGMVASISQALKFLNPMSLDVTTFAILRQLASRRNKLKEDGISLEDWFQWLSAFTGVIARKHDAVQVTALAQYVANQLKCCESLDILLLWEIVAAMAGIAPVFEVGDAQLEALGGSEALVAATVSDITSEDHSRGTVRLLSALRQGAPDHQLLMPLLILLAQQRRLITMQAQTSHLKLVAETYDRCQEVTMQYIQFLRRALSVHDYASVVPSIRELATEYQIDSEIIFEIHRPLINGVTPPNVKVQKEDEEGEIAGGGDQEEDGEVPQGGTDANVADVSNAGAASNISDDTNSGNDAWERLVDQCSLLSPDGGFKGLTQTLFITFWSLSLYDLHVPAAHYESTLTQVRTVARAARDDLEVARREAQRGWGSQQRGPSLLPTSPLDMEALTVVVNRMDSLAARLPVDLQEQRTNAAAVDARLKATRADWIKEETAEAQAAAAREFVQYCILPRVMNSPADSMFCARFLQVAHTLGPPGFRLLAVFDRIFRELGFLVRCATAREATNLGIFFAELLVIGGVLVDVSHSEFVKLSANWHRKLTLDVFRTCLLSEDYMQIKNALLVLNRLARVYPATREDALELSRYAAPIRDTDAREDLKTLARMYCTALDMAMRDKTRLVATGAEFAGLPAPRKRKAPAPAEPGIGDAALKERQEDKEIRDKRVRSEKDGPSETQKLRARRDDGGSERTDRAGRTDERTTSGVGSERKGDPRGTRIGDRISRRERESERHRDRGIVAPDRDPKAEPITTEKNEGRRKSQSESEEPQNQRRHADQERLPKEARADRVTEERTPREREREGGRDAAERREQPAQQAKEFPGPEKQSAERTRRLEKERPPVSASEFTLPASIAVSAPRGRGSLRADAPDFLPHGGKESRRSRPAEGSGDDQARDTKRQRLGEDGSQGPSKSKEGPPEDKAGSRFRRSKAGDVDKSALALEKLRGKRPESIRNGTWPAEVEEQQRKHQRRGSEKAATGRDRDFKDAEETKKAGGAVGGRVKNEGPPARLRGRLGVAIAEDADAKPAVQGGERLHHVPSGRTSPRERDYSSRAGNQQQKETTDQRRRFVGTRGNKDINRGGHPDLGREDQRGSGGGYRRR